MLLLPLPPPPPPLLLLVVVVMCWGPFSLVYNGYWVNSGCKAARTWQ
jgi:hypothetical protein